ncbi:hypothetical protein BX666DRAFT_2014203 [Dichotomocladium elegans]|nr:hypothetical protein BX666DRAFT_2015134 [Dichotomocladium elegans]KAI9309986.1 hypothetical protein BX666DRAFT_2014203 [Dichotomocladium elegans]
MPMKSVLSLGIRERRHFSLERSSLHLTLIRGIVVFLWSFALRSLGCTTHYLWYVEIAVSSVFLLRYVLE